MSRLVFEQVPILDLAPLRGNSAQRQAFARRLTQVCHEVGFVVVTNHGVDPALVEAVFDMMHRFFALSDEHKLLIDKRRSPQFRGWEPVGSEYTNNRVDVREQIDVWSEWPIVPNAGTGDLPTSLRLLGPNQWMPEDVLPGHQAITNRWLTELGHLADQLLSALSLGLGLAEHHLEAVFGDRPMSLAKFIHYPPTPAGGAGVNAHHDTGFLTVLAAGQTPGLQIQNQNDEWIDVPIVDGGFVINLGESLQAMTGNYLVATPHRVISTEERYSTGYFHGPSLATPLTRLPLDERFERAVNASPHHLDAGFMARKEETESGVGDMASRAAPATYGEQLWNYFSRSYPDQVAAHYG